MALASNTQPATLLRGWMITAAFLMLTNCLVLAPSMAYVPLLPAIKQSLSISFAQLGLFAGLAGVMAVVCSIPAGIAIDKLGARRVFLTGALVLVAGLGALSLSTALPTALLARALWQLGLRFALPALTAAMVVSIPNRHRSLALAANVAVTMAGTILALNAAARINESAGWQVAMLMFAAIAFIGALLFFFACRDSGADPLRARPQSSSAWPADRSVYKNPGVWLLCLLVIFACEEGLIDNFAGLQMGELWHTSSVEFARIISMGLGVSIVFNLIAGWCADRFGRWNMLVVSGIGGSLVGVFLLIGQMGHEGIYVVGIILAKALQLTAIIFVNSMAPAFLNGREVGPIVAIIALGSGLGQYVGPQVLGILRDATRSYTAGWGYIIACGAVATLLVVVLKRQLQSVGQGAAA